MEGAVGWDKLQLWDYQMCEHVETAPVNKNCYRIEFADFVGNVTGAVSLV